jgi:signal transduction histidine kinase
MTQSQTTAPSLLGLEEDGRDLFGLAAHKLNTPLACIRGFISTLLQRGEQLDAETVQQFLQLVLTQTDRLQGLVRDFLLLARVNGGIEALARPFRARDVLLTLVDDLSEEGVRVRFAGDVDAEVVGDAELVKLALRPLVENGLAYGPRLGMVTVTVTVAAAPEHTRWEVHDGGSRLTNERISELFRPFTRSDEPVERRGSGAGLGLTLARAYAQVLGGTVGGRADEQGTVFWVEVPVPATEAQAVPAAEGKQE